MLITSYKYLYSTAALFVCFSSMSPELDILGASGGGTAIECVVGWWRAPLCRCAPNLVASYKSLHSVDSPAHPPPHCSPTFCQNSEAQKPETFRVATFYAHKHSRRNAQKCFLQKLKKCVFASRDIAQECVINDLEV